MNTPQIFIKEIEKKWDSCRSSPSKIIRQALKEFTSAQHKIFFSNCACSAIQDLIHQRTILIDQIIECIWKKYGQKEKISLIAVGGYGRGELFPYSDIDLLIIVPQSQTKENVCVQKFLHVLWDSGLKVSCNISTLKDCQGISNEDNTIMTAMLESRFLCGDLNAYHQFKKNFDKQIIAIASTFIKHKKEERKLRHQKYNNTIHLLEPDVKNSPSGLRDIHMVMWVARVILRVTKFEQFVDKGYLTQKEYENFQYAQNHLCRFRFALHLLTKRDENRLLFELQIRIAQKFGYKKRSNKHIVELCMQDYYKHLIVIRRTCFLLLHEMDEYRQNDDNSSPTEIINERFQIRRGIMEMRNPTIFKRYPFALLEIYLLMQVNPKLRDFSAQTSRQMIEDVVLIDHKYRKDIKNKLLFMEIIRNKQGVHWALHSMHEHGILGAYIQNFHYIEGLMQFDLFHTYTVDAHSLIAVRNLLDFFNPDNSNYLMEYEISQKVAKPELLVIAILFHDIAKGRQEAHEKLGEKIVYEFCQLHFLSQEDTHLVSWLVRYHLELSMTAQKMNINAPDVLKNFIKRNQPKSILYLDCLYLLTIADISATAPNLLNDYKHSLIKQLWLSIKNLMVQNSSEQLALDSNQRIAKIRQKITTHLKNEYSEEKIQQFFNHWDNKYFIEQKVEDIIAQTHFVLGNETQKIAVQVKYNDSFKATEIFVWTERQKFQFALITTCLDQQDYSIIQAQVKRDLGTYVLYTFIVMPLSASNNRNKIQEQHLTQKIRQNLSDLNKGIPIHLEPKKRLQDRRIKTLPISTKVFFDEEQPNGQIALNLITRDRSGLLALVSKILSNFQVVVVGAYITTVGGRVEDKFLLLNSNQKSISISLQKKIITELNKAIS